MTGVCQRPLLLTNTGYALALGRFYSDARLVAFHDTRPNTLYFLRLVGRTKRAYFVAVSDDGLGLSRTNADQQRGKLFCAGRVQIYRLLLTLKPSLSLLELGSLALTLSLT